MDERGWLAERFEEKRGHLRAVAFRMLGSQSEADDAVQEAWLRLNRTDTSDVVNLPGWLTTVVARVCLDMLRSRKSRREEPLDAEAPAQKGAAEAGHYRPTVAAKAGHYTSGEDGADPERDVLLADSVGLAMLVVLERLAPAERVAFVLHDMFDLSFDEISPIVGRTPAAARQLASRARRRVQGNPAAPDVDRTRQREIVGAFLAASRGGDLGALLAVLDPDVVLRADRAAVEASTARQAQGAPALMPEIRGAAIVADTFSGRARAAQPALLDGAPGAVFAPGGTVRAAFAFTVAHGKITAIDLVADPERLRQIDVVFPAD